MYAILPWGLGCAAMVVHRANQVSWQYILMCASVKRMDETGSASCFIQIGLGDNPRLSCDATLLNDTGRVVVRCRGAGGRGACFLNSLMGNSMQPFETL